VARSLALQRRTQARRQVIGHLRLAGKIGGHHVTVPLCFLTAAGASSRPAGRGENERCRREKQPTSHGHQRTAPLLPREGGATFRPGGQGMFRRVMAGAVLMAMVPFAACEADGPNCCALRKFCSACTTCSSGNSLMAAKGDEVS